VNHHLPAKMPPTLVFHATADELVPYANSLAFRDQMAANGNRCELVTFEGLGHSYYSSNRFGEAGKAAYQQTTEKTHQFLLDLGLVKK
jgi:dipeptidyl aminopeptidase/acylaminoacyl peptidase